MKAIVVSDLHLGSRHSMAGHFAGFLRHLPAGASLILNGDTVDVAKGSLPPEHLRVLDLLREESHRRQVIWIHGNHDWEFRIENADRIQYVWSWSMPGRLYVSHGAEFLPFRRLFRMAMKMTLPIRMRLLGEPIFTVRTVKKAWLIFNILNRGTMKRAVGFAATNRYPTIVCGHMHLPADTMVAGIRYLNTGTWTEWPAHYVFIDDASISLREAGGDRFGLE